MGQILPLIVYMALRMEKNGEGSFKAGFSISISMIETDKNKEMS